MYVSGVKPTVQATGPQQSGTQINSCDLTRQKTAWEKNESEGLWDKLMRENKLLTKVCTFTIGCILETETAARYGKSSVEHDEEKKNPAMQDEERAEKLRTWLSHMAQMS